MIAREEIDRLAQEYMSQSVYAGPSDLFVRVSAAIAEPPKEQP